jgi:hypothetical protein
MRRPGLLIARLATLLLTGVLLAAPLAAMEAREIGWDDLAPEVEPYDDPFMAMSYEQIDAMRDVVAFAEADSEDPELVKADAAGRRLLEEAGHDIDYLLEQYEVVLAKLVEEATEVNPEVVGNAVRMPGYVLPLEMSGRKAVEFLLVPYVGACIHTPPPAPNQVVYVVYPEGFEAEGLFTPVWITGEMKAETTNRSVGYSDGTSDVRISYRMDASRVEDF